MAAFRVLDPFQTFFNQNSTAPAAGGRVDFFEAGTTTPKAVYANPGLSVSNGSSIELDAAGRLSVDCWGDGSYRARQYDADGTLIKELDDIQAPGGAEQQIPPLEAGSFLTNDGALLQWLALLLIPDPTGQANKFLKTDGTGVSWVGIDIPAPPTPDIVVAANSFRAGVSSNTSKFFVQWGTGSVAASGQTAANANVSFPTAFTDTPVVFVVGKSATVAAEGQIPAVAVVNQSAAGFSVAMNTDDYTRNGSKITNAVPFDWVAIGHLTVA